MAKKSILDDAKKLVWGKSQVLYGMSDFWRIRDAVKSMWDNTKAEPNRERIPVQYRMVSRFKEEMEKKVMFYAPFSEKDKFSGGGMRLDTYFNEVEPEIERFFTEGMDETSVWHVSIDIFGNKEGGLGSSCNIVKVFDLDKQISETGVISCISGEAVKDEYGLYTPAGVHEVYESIGMEFEFRLCFSVARHYVPEFDELSGELTHRELATYAEAFCLYIALKNELDKLKDEADLYGIPLKQEKQPEQPQQEQKKVLPPEFDNEEARDYFEQAIGKKLMDENYKWLKTKALCAQFAFEMSMKLELNKAENAEGQQYASWKPFEQLFGMNNLRGTYNDFKKTLEPPKGIEDIKDIFDLR